MKCTYEIRGVPVRFPYEPYESQFNVMEKMIEALQNGQNALIESPTGTGKTLSLLCAVLAWRETLCIKIQLEKMIQYGKFKGKSDSEKILAMASSAIEKLDRVLFNDIRSNHQYQTRIKEPPKIYYASRTHSQLSQAVSELKKTSYGPKIRVLASREQMCIHDQVLQTAKGASSLGNLCRIKVTKNECEYHSNVEAKAFDRASFVEDIMDIEDLSLYGKTKRLCPYYLAREDLAKADLIFLPYNYLIDSIARKAQKIDLNNAIVLFDEGHNLESSCSEIFSFDLNPQLFQSALTEIQQCIDIVSHPRYMNKSEFGPEDFAILKALIKGIHHHIQHVPLNGDDQKSTGKFPSQTSQLTKPGEYIVEIFKSVNINNENQEMVMKIIDQALEIILNESHKYKRNSSAALQSIQAAMKVVFKNGHLNGENLKRAWSCYRVHIHEEKNQQTGKLERTLSLWCFSSGVAMKDLVKLNVRSVILASGTLSPLNSFAFEMGIPFPIRIENKHVIDKSQISVNILTQGSSGQKLNSSYETRGSTQYIREMGNVVVNIARTAPDGLLVFFPSYVIMSLCMDEWKKSHQTGKSIFERINQFKKCVVEPKNKNLFDLAIEEYYNNIKAGNGGAFFAVCRGKASEGIDFSDAKGRTVIICGIPYPAAKEAKVLMKKQYLDSMTKIEPSALSGHEWYKQQAARAVNQAIGRVIRHKKDYGVIVLCDERFAQPSNINQLPVWMRSDVSIYHSYGEFQSKLINFFKCNAIRSSSMNMETIPIATSNVITSRTRTAKVPNEGNHQNAYSSFKPTGTWEFLTELQNSLGTLEFPLYKIVVHEDRLSKPVNGTSNLTDHKKIVTDKSQILCENNRFLKVKRTNISENKSTIGARSIPSSQNNTHSDSVISENGDLKRTIQPTTKEFMDMVKKSIPIKRYKEYYILLKRFHEKKMKGEEFLDNLKMILIRGLKEQDKLKAAQDHVTDNTNKSGLGVEDRFNEIWQKFKSFCPKKYSEYYEKLNCY